MTDINSGDQSGALAPKAKKPRSLLQARSYCGAKTRSGEPCKNAPTMISIRCRMHGGAGSGAPLGNQNAYKHGYYSWKAIQARQAFAAAKREAAANASQELTSTKQAAAGASQDLAAVERDAATITDQELDSMKQPAAAEPSQELAAANRDAAENPSEEFAATEQMEATEPRPNLGALLRAELARRNALKREAPAQSSLQPAKQQVNIMIEMMVVDSDRGNRGLGRREFRAIPRVGEYVAITDDQGPAAYQVVAVLYTENSLAPGIDLVVGGRMPSNDILSYIRKSRSSV
jgi:hypothetical protein